MRILDVLIVAICMKHRPEQQREITYFFDAWIPLLSLVHGKFSWAAGPVMVLLNGFTLHYLSGRPRVMDEVQGSNKKHICIYTIKSFTKERQVFFERASSWSFPHMVFINSCGLEITKMLLFWGKLLKIYIRKYNLKKCRHKISPGCKQKHIHAFLQLTTALYYKMRKHLTNTILIMVWSLV